MAPWVSVLHTNLMGWVCVTPTWWGDGSVGQCTSHQPDGEIALWVSVHHTNLMGRWSHGSVHFTPTWWPKFHPTSQGRREKPTPKSCPLTSTHAPWDTYTYLLARTHACTHAHTHSNNKLFGKKERGKKEVRVAVIHLKHKVPDNSGSLELA